MINRKRGRLVTLIFIILFVFASSIVTATDNFSIIPTNNTSKELFFSLSIKQSNAIIILNSSDKVSMQESRDYIENLGGKMRHIYLPHVFIGYVPKEISQKIIGQKNIVDIYFDEINSSTLEKYGKTAVYAANAWNKNFIGVGPKDISKPNVGPIMNDSLIPPDYEESKGSMIVHHSPPSDTETSSFMIRDISVAIIFLESNGSIDSETENWISTEESDVISEIQAGLNWWINKEPDADITFTYGHTNYSVPTSYEPINRTSYTGSADQQLWITEAMNYLGYTTGNWFSKVRTYDDDIRDSDGTDWGFTIFIVDSSNDVDDLFLDGRFAYAYLAGPFVVMTYGNDGYNIGNMDAVIAHETGHIFDAADEYAGADSCDADSDCNATFGYLNVKNQNCDRATCTSDVTCIMRSQISPYTNGNVCSYTKGQLGWRDADSDNILDAIDSDYNPDDDTDGDDIVDYWDDCPTLIGLPENDGCPLTITTPTTLLCDGNPCTNNGTFSENIEINCSGSIDPESDALTYFIYAYYNDSGDAESLMDYFNNSRQMENLTFFGNENITRYLEIPRYANVTSAYINLSGYYVENWYLEKDIVNPSFEDGIWTGSCTGTGCDCDVDRYTTWKTDGSYSMGYILDPDESNDQCAINDGGEFYKNVDFTNIKEIRFNYSSSGFSQYNFELLIDGVAKYSNVLSYGVGQIKVNTSAITGVKELRFQSDMISAAWTGGNARPTYFDQIEEHHWNYTINPYIQIDNTNVWTHLGEFSKINNKTSDFALILNTALNGGACDCSGCSLVGNNCVIPFIFHSDGKGKLEYSSLNITYQSEYDWENIGNHTTSTLNWDITNITEQSGVDLRCRAIDLDGSNLFSTYYNPLINLTITSISSNDTHKFYIKNSSDDAIAWLGDLGNIVLKGKCFYGGNCNNPGENSFMVKNINDTNVAFINSSGDLCVITGDCSDESTICNPARDAFIIRDSSDNNVSYIDFDGDLCLTGKLYENSNL